MKPRILIVDDEPDALALLGYRLKEAGMHPFYAYDGATAINLARTEKPSAIILDVMLPEVDGLEVVRILRRDPVTASIPILILSAKAEEMDRVVALEIGANDYVTKPFSPRELVLRVRNLVERVERDPVTVARPEEVVNQFKTLLAQALPEDGKPVELRTTLLSISVAHHEVRVEGKVVSLTATEFNLLEALARRRGRVLPRAQLLKEVFGYEESSDSRTVDTHMRRLRKKLGKASRYLETIRSHGYRFSPLD